MNIAVLASGSGTTLQYLIDHSQKNPDDFQVQIVGSDRVCPAIFRAIEVDIPVVDYKEVFNCKSIDIVCLAGFLKKIHIDHNWNRRVINIHPALLPAFGGEGMYGMKVHEAVLRAGVLYTGCTIHLCDNKYDTGPIIHQEIVPIKLDWTAEDISTEVQRIEKKAYVKVLKAISEAHEEGRAYDCIFDATNSFNRNLIKNKLRTP